MGDWLFTQTNQFRKLATCNGILVAIYFLLSRQIRLSQEIQARLETRSQMLDLANDTIIIRNFDGEISYWNQGAERLYGWTIDEVLGKNSRELLATVFPQPIEKIIDHCLHHDSWEGELIHTKRDRNQVTVSSRWTLERDQQSTLIAYSDNHD